MFSYFPRPTRKECWVNAIDYDCPACKAKPGQACISMTLPLSEKASAAGKGHYTQPGAPIKVPHESRCEAYIAQFGKEWEASDAGKRFIAKHKADALQRQAEQDRAEEERKKRQQEAWERNRVFQREQEAKDLAARKRREEEALRKKRAAAESKSYKSSPVKTDDVSSTYKVRWEVYWQGRNDSRPIIDDGAEWFPVGPDAEGRMAWRRPIRNVSE